MSKRIFQGFGLFGLTYAITRAIFLMSDYENAINLGNPTYILYDEVTAAYSVTFAALIFIYYAVERLMLNRKPVFMVIAIIAAAVCLVAFILTFLKIGVDLAPGAKGPQTIAQYTLYITGPLLMIGIVALYIVISRMSSGSVRKKSIGALIGLLILSAGLLLDMDILTNTTFDPYRLILAPVCFIVGTLTFFIAQK
ncbi:MAG TPA: hypothetical protein VKM55_25445 [Candidatus Lokiarchaeia archaeon]|nr:hypothetical protein [Candidatus Lokiarchaeia archaeon]